MTPGVYKPLICLNSKSYLVCISVFYIYLYTNTYLVYSCTSAVGTEDVDGSYFTLGIPAHLLGPDTTKGDGLCSLRYVIYS